MLNRNQIILLSLPSLQQSLAVCGLLGKCLWCPSSIPGQIISNLKMRLPAIIARGGFLLCCQVWMLMLRFVGWPLLCCAWRIFPSTVNTSSGSREQPQLCVLTWWLILLGTPGQALDKRKEPLCVCFPIPYYFFVLFFPPFLSWENAFYFQILVYGRAEGVSPVSGTKSSSHHHPNYHLAFLLRDQNQQSPVGWTGRCPNSLRI